MLPDLACGTGLPWGLSVLNWDGTSMHLLANENHSSSSLLAMFFNFIDLARICLRRGKCLFLSVFLLGISSFFSFSGSQEVIDRIAAVVNDSVITLSDVKIAESFHLFDEENEPQANDFFGILNELINQKLVIGLTQKSISVEQEAIESAYQSLLNKLGNESVETRLELFGLQKEDLQVYLYEKILYQRIIENRFGLAIRVSLKEIEEFYRETFVPAQSAKNIEPPPMMEVLEEIESAIKKDKIRTIAVEWLNNLRREADIQFFLKEETS
jgi:hypothetical protein